MTSMLERVARALNPKAWESIDAATQKATEKGWDVALATRHLRAGVDQSLETARTAIEAMVNLSEPMASAGAYSIGHTMHEANCNSRAKKAWAAMIGKALE